MVFADTASLKVLFFPGVWHKARSGRERCRSVQESLHHWGCASVTETHKNSHSGSRNAVCRFMTKCYQMYSFLSTLSRITDGRIDSGLFDVDWKHVCFLLFHSPHNNFISSLGGIWNINKTAGAVHHFAWSQRKRSAFIHERHRHKRAVFLSCCRAEHLHISALPHRLVQR